MTANHPPFTPIHPVNHPSGAAVSDQDVTAAELLVTEYEALKREQAARIGTRDNLVYATLAGMGLVIAAGLREGSPTSLLLLLPPAVLVLGWTRVANDVKVTHIGRYLRCEVAARFEAITGEPALGWEHAHRADSRRLLRMMCQLVADLTLFVAAPMAAVGAYWLTGPWTTPLLVVSMAEALLVTGFAIVLAAYSGVFDRPTPDDHLDDARTCPCAADSTPTRGALDEEDQSQDRHAHR